MDPIKFGIFVQERRKELGMRQSELAERLNVTPKAVSRWERGVGFPDIKLLEPLAEALNITLIELMQSQKMEEPIPGETAAEVMSDTINAIRQQDALSRKQKTDLVWGTVLIGASAAFVYCLGRFYTFDPRWIGSLLRLIALVGGVWGWRAFRSIITEDYLKEQKEDIWYTWKPWAACGASLSGAVLCVFLKDFFPRGSAGFTFCVFLGTVLLFPGIYYLSKYVFKEE